MTIPGVSMRPARKTILCVVLSAMVILTGLGVASSRGIDKVAGQMVLCTGAGPVVVYMDKDGQPTQAPHYCPEFALSLLGAVEPQPADLPYVSDALSPQPPRGATSLIAADVPNRPARSPPVVV